MPYPSTISTIAIPKPTDRLNNPSHSGVENAQSSAIGEIETFMGLESGPTASAVGTLLYDIRAAASKGGGHVQGVEFGGTRQTSYNKGDILIAQSASLLTKLAVGADGAFLQANSSVATGVTWSSQTVFPKIIASASVITVVNTATETSIFSVTIPGSTLGTGNVIRTQVYINNFNNSSSNDTLTLRPMFGTTSLATATITPTTGDAVAAIKGKVEFNLIANNSVTVQKGITILEMWKQKLDPYTNSSIVTAYYTAPAGEDSAANKVVGLTATWNNANPDNGVSFDAYIIEKIS